MENLDDIFDYFSNENLFWRYGTVCNRFLNVIFRKYKIRNELVTYDVNKEDLTIATNKLTALSTFAHLKKIMMEIGISIQTPHRNSLHHTKCLKEFVELKQLALQGQFENVSFWLKHSSRTFKSLLRLEIKIRLNLRQATTSCRH